MSHRAEISFFIASSLLIARLARETSRSLAPAAHFANFESLRNGDFLRTRDGRYAVTGGSGDLKSGGRKVVLVRVKPGNWYN
jgi:hypothetical protein